MNTVCDRDWQEDFEHDNGNYMNTCCECKNTFTGHKRRVVCKACATISQDGEAVEVVAWRHWGDKTRLLCDLGKQRAIPGTIADEFTVPLMTVAQHQRILLSTVIRYEQKGAFKICLECGYQDGHDLICQYHESKRAAVSDDLTNVRCLCCQSEHAHNSYDAGFIAGSGMCQACDSALPAKDIVSITHPADQAADDLTMVKVPVELLERIIKRGMRLPDETQHQHLEELRALLAKSEGVKP